MALANDNAARPPTRWVTPARDESTQESLRSLRGFVDARLRSYFEAMRTLTILAIWTWAMMFSGVPAEAQEPMSSQELVELNMAIGLFQDGNFSDAKKILAALLEQDPDNLTATYYFGLVRLREGLNYSKAKQKAEAKQAFDDAGTMFEIVIKSVEPGLRPVEAALDLGIASLGKDDPDADRETNVRYAQSARDTLEEYVRHDHGRSDRHGYFFLGIACYRLHFLKSAETGLLSRANEVFGETLRLARADRIAGKIGVNDLSSLEARVLYYKGLIGIQGRRLVAARKDLDGVVKLSELTGGGLYDNAKTLIEKIDRELQEHPGALSFDTAIGPVDFFGGVTITNQFDSNIILLGYHTAVPLGLGQQHDYRVGVQADIDLTRTIYDSEGLPFGRSLLLGVGGTTFNLWQPNVGEYNLNTYTGRAYLNWEAVPDLFLGLQYDYSYTQLGHEPFLASQRITPVISKRWREKRSSEMVRENGEVPSYLDETARTDFFYIYDYRDYRDELTRFAFDRDGSYHAVGFIQKFNLMRAHKMWENYYTAGHGQQEGADCDRWFSMRVGYLYRNERTQGDEFDLYGNTVLIDFDVPLPLRLTFDFGADFSWDEYSQASIVDFRRRERSDFVQHYNFGLTRIFLAPGEDRTNPTLDIRARFGIDLTYQDSNVVDRLGQDIYSYDRAVYSLQLAIRF